MASTNPFLTLVSTIQTNSIGSTIATGYIPYVSTAGRQAYTSTLTTLAISTLTTSTLNTVSTITSNVNCSTLVGSTLTTTNVNTSTMVTSSLNTNTLTSSALNTTTLTLASLSVIPSGNTISLIGTNSANNQVVTSTAPAYYYGYVPWNTNGYTNYLPWTTSINVNVTLSGTSISPSVAGYYKITATIVNGGASSNYYYYGYKNGSEITGMRTLITGLGSNFNPTSMCGMVYMNGSSDYFQIYGPNNTLSGGGAMIVVERLLP